MTNIISTKDGRLHIYVRQDKYKGKLKSENWVGRTFHNGKQKVISSGTTDLEEAKIILEKWYDDLISGKLEENLDNKENNINNFSESEISDPKSMENEQEIKENTKDETIKTSTPNAVEEKKKKK